MKRINTFIKTSLIGGFAVILPITILILIFKWIFNFIIQIIQPLTNLVVARSDFQVIVADLVVLGIILSSFFLVGAIVRTKIGKFIQKHFDNSLAKLVPGYGIIKSTVTHLLERKRYPFSSVALVQAFENDTLMTAFVIDTHPSGRYTVFVPTGPNPTTGYIFHMEKKYVHPVMVSVEEALRSVISCGVGSKPLLDAFYQIRQ
jgi:uncharacterized membrane protein